MNAISGAWLALQHGGWMVYPLVLLALVAMVIMLDKAYVYWRHVHLPASLVDLIERYELDWDTFERQLEGLGSRHVIGHFFRVIFENRERPVWWIEARAGDAAQDGERSLARGLWVLETIVTAAPLLGLLGTITGMMQAFRMFGASGLVDPAGVTSGVAEALIVTALGLLIALVSLFGFNFFARRQTETMDQMERLGTRLVDHIRLDREDVAVHAQSEAAR